MFGSSFWGKLADTYGRKTVSIVFSSKYKWGEEVGWKTLSPYFCFFSGTTKIKIMLYNYSCLFIYDYCDPLFICFPDYGFMCMLDFLFWIHQYILSTLLLDHSFTLLSWFWNWRGTTVVSVPLAVITLQTYHYRRVTRSFPQLITTKVTII